MTCDKQKFGLDSHTSFLPLSVCPRSRVLKEWSFVRKTGSESEFFYLFWFCFVCSLFVCFVQGFKII